MISSVVRAPAATTEPATPGSESVFNRPGQKGRLRDGSIATFEGTCTITGRARVRDPRGGVERAGTVWLLHEDGRAFTDGGESPFDWIEAL